MHKLYSFGFDKMTFFFKQLSLFSDIRTLFMPSGKKWTKTDLKMLLFFLSRNHTETNGT
jgi:hypothetical protein